MTWGSYKNLYEDSKGFDLEYSNMLNVKKFHIWILLCIDKIHFPHLDRKMREDETFGDEIFGRRRC